MNLKIALVVAITLLLAAVAFLVFSFEKTPADYENMPQEEVAMCTADAMMCPDGTMVGRTGADCQFVCPDLPEQNLPVEKPISTPEPAPPVADCSTSSEQACVSDASCQAVYGPSFCDGTTCTTDQAFQGCTSRPETSLLQVCPDEWIRNLMPMAGESPYPREYYIIDSQRRELTEFDNNWIANNCQLEASVVY
jgi:hypothetical protein